MTLQDVVAPAKPAKPGFPVDIVAGDFAVAGAAEKLVADRPDVIFHLAAIVSGEAELDFDKGYRINLDGTRMLLDAIRLVGGGYKPRLVFTSSIAVFGAPFPDAIGDEFFHTPLLSYGTQKAIGELLLADYSRSGLHGRHQHPAADHLHPARPAEQGRLRLLLQHPARAAGRQGSGPAGIGRRAALARHAALGGRLPVPCRDHGPCDRRARGATSPCPACPRPSANRSRRLKRVAGDKVAARIKREPDPFIMGIVDGWPRNFDAERARQARLHHRRKDL